MSAIVYSRKKSWTFISIILLLAVVLLIFAPEEQTLGSGIRSVYVHVALTWTGMAGFLLAGVLGLGTAITGKHGLQEWAHTISWVAVILFAAGLVMSIIAAGINWGAVFWQEPRTNSAFQVLAAALIVQVANSWQIPYRIKGILNFSIALLLLWSVLSTPLVLHPGSAARTSPSAAIRFTFLGLFILCSLAASWLVLNIQRAKSNRVNG